MASPTVEACSPTEVAGETSPSSSSIVDHQESNKVSKGDSELLENVQDDSSVRQVFSDAGGQASSSTGSTTAASNRRNPQRKLSVFSHNGFQQLDQLDQASLRQHGALEQQIQQNQSQQNSSGSSSSGFDSKDSRMSPSSDSSSKTSGQRSARTDTLGSNGSSRASSCDEPAAVQQKIAANLTTDSMIATDANQPVASQKHSDLSISSSSTTTISHENQPNKCSSSSSLESMGNQSSSTNQDKTPPASNQSQKRTDDTSVPSFESIKTQIKRDSIPNAEFIQQHIDRLISQNEAIIDNWNLVSIRSYNSGSNNNQGNSHPSTTEALTQRRQAVVGVTSNIDTKQDAKQLDYLSNRRNKRWSTNTISGPIQLSPRHGAHDSSATIAHSSKLLFQPKAGTSERKRSWNMSTLNTIPQQQQLNLEFKNLSGQYKQQMIDCEMENSTLRRRQQETESLLRQHMIQHQHRHDQPQQALDLALAQLQQQHLVQQEQDFMTALLESQRRQHQLESQLLNEYLSKMMLNNGPSATLNNHNFDQNLSTSGGNITSNVIVNNRLGDMVNNESCPESPLHKCEACDVSFWTQDLLNYHMITQCSARQGPQSARPLAFNFAGLNNFDSLASQQQQEQQLSKTRRANLLAVPSTAATATRPLAIPSQRHSHHQLSDHEPSKSASPPRRRTLDNESVNEGSQDEQIASKLFAQTGNIGHLLASNDLEENLRLSILKQQLLNNGIGLAMGLNMEPQNLSMRGRPLSEVATMAQHDQLSAMSQVSSSSTTTSLPFKKRKISEPNMKY